MNINYTGKKERKNNKIQEPENEKSQYSGS
jgi:hypothetical protein